MVYYLLGGALVGCNGSGDTADVSAPAITRATDTASAAVVPSQEEVVATLPKTVDLQSVMNRAHFAFRQDGDAWRGGHDTYGTEVRLGTYSVQPFQPPLKAGGRERAGVQLHLTTTSISRDPEAATSVRAIASLTVDPRTGGVVAAKSFGAINVAEQFDNRPSGAEQSWRFASRPHGTGDLEVRVAASGMRYKKTDAAGLHFFDADTALGLGYGHGTWVDATGAKTRVPAQWDAAHSEIVLQVPAAVVDAAQFPAVLDPVVGPESAVGGVVVVPANADQRKPAIGHGGSLGFMVVWADKRRMISSRSDIFAARVAADGTVTDTLGLVIDSATTDDIEPSIHFDPVAIQYLVVWQKQATYSEIWGVRLNSLGVATSSPDKISFGTLFHATDPDVVYVGATQPLFAFTYFANGAVRVRAINAGLSTGAFVYPVAFASFAREVSLVHPNQSQPAIAHSFYNGNLGLSYTTCTNAGVCSVAIQILDPINLGLLLGTTIIGANGTSSDIAYGQANDFVVAWADRRNQATNGTDIYARRINAITLAFVGTEFLVDGAVGDQEEPAVAGFGAPSQTMVAWVSRPSGGGPGTIFTQRFQNGVAHGAKLALSPGTGESSPAAHSDDMANYLVVWTDMRNSTASSVQTDIYGARLSFTGVNQDPTNRLITQGTNTQVAPAIATCGSKYLIAWADNRNAVSENDIYAVIKNTSNGSLVTSFAVSNAAGIQENPAVACNGTDFFVVWEDSRNVGTTGSDIYGTRVTAAGVVLNPTGVVIANTAGSEISPAVAANADQYLVAWSAPNGTAGRDIFATRVNWTTGAVVAGSLVTPSGPAAEDQTSPAIAAEPQNNSFLVVWQNGYMTDGFLKFDIFGRRVLSNSGMDAAPFAVENQTDDQRLPTVAWNPGLAKFIVAYEDLRNYATTAVDIYSRQVSANGNVAGTAVALIAAPGSDFAPRIASVTNNLARLVYWRFSDDFNRDVIGVDLNAGIPGPAFNIAASAAFRDFAPTIACASASNCMVTYRKNGATTANTDWVVSRNVN